jgi:RNA polymerase sigma-70 factor (ECF subfamily)
VVQVTSDPLDSQDGGDGSDVDRVLVERARAGDYVAFESLVRRHQRRVYAVALGILKNTAEAEEVAQETFLSAFEHLDGFRGDARFSTWLYRVASNHALMKLRKKRPDPQGDLVDLEPQLSRAATRTEGTSPFDALSLWARRPDEALAANEVQDALESALDELGSEDRALLLLRSLDDVSHDVLAEMFETTVPAIKSRLHRTRLHLRALLDARLRGKPPPDARS